MLGFNYLLISGVKRLVELIQNAKGRFQLSFDFRSDTS
ncbi:hypothetical protein P186_2673 [Pyrobaculum ferrireducens]|uniref:Uncharacterized protein n=1 Tax=Pyrobaculum ferrireducens TaxID=1104324 RepID=G7VE87_9CREN|nr:hypothetical protein P186_2673 [Pyrobaculum ferrireducens]